MSQQHGFPPPPPPPAQNNGSPAASAAPYFTQQRRRTTAVQPPSISTNFHQTQGVGSTPATALASATTPFPHSPAVSAALSSRSTGSGFLDPGAAISSQRVPPNVSGSPSMAQQPYNPRQWSGHGSRMTFASQSSPLSRDTMEVTGMEAAMPSPPPPYSPETPDIAFVRTSAMVDHASFVSSPLSVEASGSSMSHQTPVRGSPQIPMSPAFPPPPGQMSRHRERSASGQRLFNTIQNLTGRGKQPANSEIQASSSMHLPQDGETPRPPAARRAASTGHVYPASSTPTPPPQRAVTGSSTGRSSPEGPSWHPGMPLPGPPPGPPPPGARSQSLNRYPASSSRSNSITSEHSIEAPAPQRRAAQASTLGPVPPTPADWVDTDSEPQQAPHMPPDLQQSSETFYQPLRINTGAQREQSLTRRPAHRDVSAQGIRERRSKSRAARDGGSSNTMSPVSDSSRPGDLVFSPVEGSISQRREHMRKISGYASLAATAHPGHSPRAVQPQSAKREPTVQAQAVLTPPYTPAVGGQTTESSQRRVPSSASSDRPISHLLHAPNDDTSAMPAPSSPARPPSSGSMKSSTRLEPFFLQAMERHRAFVEKESSATTDEERLELFANYLVHESRLRRDRYQTAYSAMAGDIVDMTRDMWRSYTRTGKRAVTPSTSMSSFDHTIPSWASDGQPASARSNIPGSASSIGEFTPATDTGSIGDFGESQDHADSRQWGEQFKPSLSPIPSMAQSTVPDENSSRGRTASRWWEASDNSGSVGRPDRIEKSHRETKYMGINPAMFRESPQPSPEIVRATPTPGTSSFTLGPHEYPPEKVGWHEGHEFDTPMATPARPGDNRKSSPSGAEQLDVSRLITLPPPYPRHHPAVNNSHPQLSDLRNAHRQLVEHEEIQRIKDAYLDQDWALQKSQQEDAKQRRNRLRTSVQEKLNAGTISFAEAARAEGEFNAEEAERGKASARVNFDTFEAAVSHPLNTLLTAGLDKANASISHLRTDLDSSAGTSDPNRAQEEGDEHPERLEKLTLLKWLFEAREGLHKEMFELHAQRSEKYSEVILTPYRISKQQAKIDEAAAFFAKDNHERQAVFAKESSKRFQELQGIVDNNVTRGVEDQLSAFWDIAPGLLEVVQAVPHSDAGLAALHIAIPQQEYDENPQLAQWPLQYLYSLLSHAEKSAYQFIESQTNLLCLLHEVRSASAGARFKLAEVARAAEEDVGEEIKAEMLQARRSEERRLDGDLKEKVGEVERQWREALGDGLERCKMGVRSWLEERGGWVEGLEG